ncbi:MAG: hypothetical protein GY699_07140 [Desulfobacteraceae bacterium]|nr:hypothetical protein [Desulfobacteraceae bacterium]
MEKLSMKRRYMHISRIIILCFIFLILSICSCNRHQANSDNYTSSLKTAYQALWMTKGGLEYPPRQEILDICKQGKDPGCLKVYKHVQEGKETLLSKIASDPERTLAFTLDTICTQCEYGIDEVANEKKGLEIEGECLGAITSLYFFNKDHQDKVILDRFKNASPKVLTWVFATSRFEWFYNRPNPDRWIEFSNNIPDDIIKEMARPPGEMQREFIIEEFEKKIDDIEKFGVML